MHQAHSTTTRAPQTPSAQRPRQTHPTRPPHRSQTPNHQTRTTTTRQTLPSTHPQRSQTRRQSSPQTLTPLPSHEASLTTLPTPWTRPRQQTPCLTHSPHPRSHSDPHRRSRSCPHPRPQPPDRQTQHEQMTPTTPTARRRNEATCLPQTRSDPQTRSPPRHQTHEARRPP